jgi:hypothetical protein
MGRDRDRADLDRRTPLQSHRTPRSGTSPNDSALPRCSRRIRTNALQSALCAAPRRRLRAARSSDHLWRAGSSGTLFIAVAVLRLRHTKLSMRKAIRSICAALHRLRKLGRHHKKPALGRTRRRGCRPFRRSWTREGPPHEISLGLREFRPVRLSIASRALHGTSRPLWSFRVDP